MSHQNTNYGNMALGLLVMVTIIMLFAIGPYYNIVRIATFGLLPLLFIISLFIDMPFLTKNKKEYLLLVFLFFSSLFSVFFYIDYEYLMRGYSSLLGAIVIAFIPLSLNKFKDYTKYFHIGYVIAVLILIFVMYIEKNFDFSTFATKKDYRDRFMLNANQYSYFSFFANFSLFYLHQRYKSLFTTLLLIALPLLFLIINFVTLSRAGLAFTLLINIVYWIFVNKVQMRSSLMKVIRYIIFLFILAFLAVQFTKVYEQSRIKNRVNEVKHKTDSRVELIFDGINTFAENPIMGVGLNQAPYYTRYHQMTHNAYTEIFSEQGLIGGIILLFLFGIPLKNCYQLFKKDPKNALLKINLLFFITFYLYNNFYTFYKFSFSMLYFFLVISIQYKIEMELDQHDSKEQMNQVK